MTDRIDIDALLIGALYGELTPADEARLTAHLESHPADRTALADLTQTRATVRESRILTVQFEPPQSVSARLLQEAARRAPKRRESAIAGWFHRFTRSFLMHPAMAAAAMLVLVVGVAGTLYVRRGDQFVEMAAPASAVDQVAVPSSVQPAPATTVPEASATGSAEDHKNHGVLGNAGSAAGSDAYRVGLDEPADLKKVAAQDEPQAPSVRTKDSKGLVIESDDQGEGNAAKEVTRGRAQERAFTPPAKPEASVPRPAKKAASSGIELRSAEMAPKDLDSENLQKNDKKQDSPKRALYVDAERDRASATASDGIPNAPGAAPAGGGAATVVPGMIAPRGHAAAAGPAPEPAAVAANSPPSNPSTGAKAKAPAKTVSRTNQAAAPAPSLSPPPSPAAAAAPPSLQRDNRRLADKPAAPSADLKLEDKAGDDKALIDWAQKQREQVLAFVKSNNCRAAANTAVAIYNRAPEFYAANIATDRSIKPCIAYVNDVREREDRSRAAMKRANAADTPAQAAPPTQAAPPAKK